MIKVIFHFFYVHFIFGHLLLSQTPQGLHPLTKLFHVDLRIWVVNYGVNNIRHRDVQAKPRMYKINRCEIYLPLNQVLGAESVVLQEKVVNYECIDLVPVI